MIPSRPARPGRTTRRAARARVSVVLGFALLVGASVPAVGQASGAAERRAVDRAERLRDAGRPAEAVGALIEFLAEAPASVAALALLGALSGETGDASDYLAYARLAVETAPDAPALRAVFVDALVAAGLQDSARAVATRWVEAEPSEARAVLALADAQVAAGDPDAAIRTLRASVASPTREALARLADLLAGSGDASSLSEAWSALLALDPPGVEHVVDDLRGAEDDRTARLAELADDASARSDRIGRHVAIVALRLGEPGIARRMARAARSDDPTEGAAFLREYVREAEDATLPAEVAWAAGELVGLSPRPVDRMRWQALAADQALVAGDTGSARRAFVDLTRDSEPGAGPYGLASRRLFSLLAADPSALDEAERLLERYARVYPDSNGVEGGMRGELALGYARADALSDGEEILVEGRRRLPDDALGGLESAAAWLALYAGRRDSVIARAQRSLSGPDLDAAEQTRRIRLLTLAQTADSAEIEIVGPSAHALLTNAEDFDPGPTLRELAGVTASPGRPTALAFLADESAEAGRGDLSLALRRRIVERYSSSPEAPAALLALARAADAVEAAAWLERLIVGYPESALAPVARRMLTRIQREGR